MWGWMGDTYWFLWHWCAGRCRAKCHLEEFVRVGNGLLHALPELPVIAGIQDSATYPSTHKQQTCTNDFAHGNTEEERRVTGV